ncbi:hypothetical protein [Actinopolymorpha pittospori]|uniref:Uncharacterized protein n=1 Tax=Actinopolymorpha pittospori TaxID=648752 RepID=A0A927MPN8_9ACTN|nr:hypothetical protein [Actinopolymorpha pittospori]MBE1604374.1 hypothetical protein [Actinopolymorpha pittospori]
MKDGFAADYAAETLEEWPSSLPDHTFTPPGTSQGRASLIRVMPYDGPEWTASVSALPDPPRRAVTGLFATPNPATLCVLQQGTPFLIEVMAPRTGRCIDTGAAVTSVREAGQARLLLLATDWDVLAVGTDGVAWRTDRISVERLRIDEIDDLRLRGVADPDDDEPRDFAIDLTDGTTVGGAGPF